MISNDSSFLTDVATQVAANNGEQPVCTLSEAWHRIGLALLRLENVIHRPGEMSRTERSREELVRIAATAWLAALQLGIDSRSDAISKDIPF